MKKETNIKKNKLFKLSISVYLAALMGVIITAVATVLMFITMSSVKDLVGEYESNVNKLNNYLVTVLAQVATYDATKKNLTTTNDLMKFYKDENLLAYLYITDDKTNSVVLC